MKTVRWIACAVGLLLSIVVATITLLPTRTWALPVTGCVATNRINTCTLVEIPETGEPGSAETISITLATGIQNNGFVPIFESASGVPSSAFPITTNPPGVVGAVSDYLIITNDTSITLVSDGFAIITALLSGLSQLQPVAANGTPVSVSEPAEGILNQSVEFFLRSPGGFLDHFIIFSDTSVAPEPATLVLLSFGLAGLAGFAWRRQPK